MKATEAAVLLKEAYKEHILSEIFFLGETTLEITSERIKETLGFLKERGFDILVDLTAVDYIKPLKRTKVVYLLRHSGNYENLRLTVFVDRGQSIPSVTNLWEGADWYERELFDLFGIHFTDHPDMKRILMPDDWQGHPLLKDYALTEESVEFKHGVNPKVPSQIIPYDKSLTKS